MTQQWPAYASVIARIRQLQKDPGNMFPTRPLYTQLRYGFSWLASKQGFEFWHAVYKNLAGEPLPYSKERVAV